MSGHTSTTTTNLTRTDVWSDSLKSVVEAELGAQKHVRWLSNFPDGEVFNIPSVGQAQQNDYVEGQAIKYTPLDTGNFEFSVTEYVQSGTYITNKAKQDLFYAQELISQFVPSQHRAIMTRLEKDILRVGPEQQTSANANSINGVAHRWVGTGTSNSISAEDFARARLALRVANMPMTNLIAIVDPSVEFTFNTLPNFTNLIYNPMWEGVVRDGVATGMRFKANIYGFDVYVSDFLKSGISETIYGQAVTNGVANLFFSAAGGDITPFVGAIRQAPKVESKYNMDLQREEFATTMRYGVKTFRKENLVVVLTDNTIAAPTYS